MVEFGVRVIFLQGQVEIFHGLVVKPLIQTHITPIEVVDRVARVIRDRVIIRSHGHMLSLTFFHLFSSGA